MRWRRWRLAPRPEVVGGGIVDPAGTDRPISDLIAQRIDEGLTDAADSRRFSGAPGEDDLDVVAAGGSGGAMEASGTAMVAAPPAPATTSASAVRVANRAKMFTREIVTRRCYRCDASSLQLVSSVAALLSGSPRRASVRTEQDDGAPNAWMPDIDSCSTSQDARTANSTSLSPYQRRKAGPQPADADDSERVGDCGGDDPEQDHGNEPGQGGSGEYGVVHRESQRQDAGYSDECHGDRSGDQSAGRQRDRMESGCP